MLDEKLGNDPSSLFNGNHYPSDIYIYIYIRDSQLKRPESVSLASLARQLETWFALWSERAHSLKLFCMYDKRFEISKTKLNGGGNRTTDLTIYLHHLILAFIIRNQIIFVYIHKYIHALYIMNCSKK